MSRAVIPGENPDATPPLEPRLELTWDAGGQMALPVLSPDSRPCVIQRSADLLEWSDWQVVVPVQGIATAVDAETTPGDIRFYRVKTE